MAKPNAAQIRDAFAHYFPKIDNKPLTAIRMLEVMFNAGIVCSGRSWIKREPVPDNPKPGDHVVICHIGPEKSGGITSIMYVKCRECGKEEWQTIAWVDPKNDGSKYRCEACESIARREFYKKYWETKLTLSTGYVVVRIPSTDPLYSGMKKVNLPRAGNDWVHEHRLVIARLLGRPLGGSEIVHHIDRNKTNNELTNLVLMTRGQHYLEHFKGYLNWRGPLRDEMCSKMLERGYTWSDECNKWEAIANG